MRGTLALRGSLTSCLKFEYRFKCCKVGSCLAVTKSQMRGRHDMHMCTHGPKRESVPCAAEGSLLYECALAKTNHHQGEVYGFTVTYGFTVQVNGVKIRTRRLTSSSTLTRRHAYQYTHSALTLYILSRGAFGGPSPASLTACPAPPPRVRARPHPPTHTLLTPLPCPDICLCRARQTQRSSCWCSAQRLSNTCR